MTAQELKNSILQYAVQGKLVPQDPTDEPASVLLERIKAEKAQLIKDKKIKTEKPLAPITDEEIPFEIPESWVYIRMSDVCWLEDGIKSTNEKLPLLDAKTLRGKSKDTILNEGKIVLPNQKVILVDGENSGEVFNVEYRGYLGSTFKILGINKLINEYYLEIILLYYKSYFRGNKIGAAIPHLNKNLFKTLVITLPPLAEQQRIVAKIEELMPLVEEYDKAEKELTELNAKFPEQIKKSVLQYAIQGKLVAAPSPLERAGGEVEPASELLKRIKAEKQQLIKEKKIKAEKPLPPITDEEIPFEIPESWVWVRLGEIVSILGDGIHGTPNYDTNGDYFFINGNNLDNGKIVIKDSTKRINHDEFLKHKKELNKRSILVSINGTLGNIAFYNNEKVILGKSACYFNLFEPINMEYVRIIIKSKHFEDYALTSATQTTIQNVSLKSMRELPIPLPPLSEQQRIVEKVEEVLGVCEGLKA